MFVCMCVCLFGLLYSCVISAQGDFVCALCVWFGFCCIGIPVFVCVCLCKPIRMHAKSFFLFTARCSSHLYIYFSQRVLCSELPKDLFTQWLTDSCLSRFIVPYTLWWNKNLQHGTLKKFIMSVTVEEGEKSKHPMECELNVHTASLTHAHW